MACGRHQQLKRAAAKEIGEIEAGSRRYETGSIRVVSMSNLKHDMRRMFEERGAVPSYGSDSRMEEGALKSIISLALLNYSSFGNTELGILAVKSERLLQKLYRLADYNRLVIEASAVLLITCDRAEAEKGKEAGAGISLLSMSIMFSSKYFGYGFTIPEGVDMAVAGAELGIGPGRRLEKIICLGGFDNSAIQAKWKNIRPYEEVVREI